MSGVQLGEQRAGRASGRPGGASGVPRGARRRHPALRRRSRLPGGCVTCDASRVAHLGDELFARMDAELLVDVPHMGVDGRLGDVELVADVGQRLSLREVGQNLSLAVRQAVSVGYGPALLAQHVFQARTLAFPPPVEREG